jgi:hypothetical protein
MLPAAFDLGELALGLGFDIARRRRDDPNDLLIQDKLRLVTVDRAEPSSPPGRADLAYQRDTSGAILATWANRRRRGKASTSGWLSRYKPSAAASCRPASRRSRKSGSKIGI